MNNTQVCMDIFVVDNNLASDKYFALVKTGVKTNLIGKNMHLLGDFPTHINRPQ